MLNFKQYFSKRRPEDGVITLTPEMPAYNEYHGCGAAWIAHAPIFEPVEV